MHTQNTSPFRPETYATRAAAIASEQGFRQGDWIYTDDGKIYVGNDAGGVGPGGRLGWRGSGHAGRR